jgi:hypothetical protein
MVISTDGLKLVMKQSKCGYLAARAEKLLM